MPPYSPECELRIGRRICGQRGTHLCEPRARRVVNVFEQILVHTKGLYARQPFKLTAWQRQQIVKPLFGTVEWDRTLRRWARQYRIGWIELARKNGKSELLAGIALTLLVADDEEGAEVYGAACDRDQARKVFDVAARMVQLSPLLSRRLRIYHQAKRIVDDDTGSYYECIASDAAGNLGHNPHGIIFDEVITQPSADLWNALRTGMGARSQPLMVAATTAGDDPVSFAAQEHDYCRNVLADPALDRRRFVFMRNTPTDVDWRNEANWHHANPALATARRAGFLSIEALRDECREAQLSPAKEQAFRQFRLNQWVQAENRFMDVAVYDASTGLVDEQALVGQRCYGGLDLAAVRDLTSLAWFFPPADEGSAGQCLWRHFVPEAAVDKLNDYTGGAFATWVRAGWCTVTEGDVLDYDAVHGAIAADASAFAPVSLGIDRWNSTATTNWLAEHAPSLAIEKVSQTFGGLSAGLKQIDALVHQRRFNHGGNPVARWCFGAVTVKQDDQENIKPRKPDRQRERHRIDAVVSATMAVDGWLRQPAPKRAHKAAGF